MRFYYITFRSVTYAQRAEKLLTRRGFRVNLVRTPRWMEEQGCGYALKFRTADIQPVVNLLRENRLQLRRVYFQLENGEMEEVML